MDFNLFSETDYTLIDPDFMQPQQQPLPNKMGFINPNTVDPTTLLGGGSVRTVMGQEQMTTNATTTQSRYPQRERILIQRTPHRAISHVYPMKNPLSQIDSDEEGPSDLNPMRGMPRNFPFQQNIPIPLMKTEEQKVIEGNSDSKMNKFFTK